jgi:hypothetical protein
MWRIRSSSLDQPRLSLRVLRAPGRSSGRIAAPGMSSLQRMGTLNGEAPTRRLNNRPNVDKEGGGHAQTAPADMRSTERWPADKSIALAVAQVVFAWPERTMALLVNTAAIRQHTKRVLTDVSARYFTTF